MKLLEHGLVCALKRWIDSANLHVVVEAEASVYEFEEDLLKAVDVLQTLVAHTIL